MTNFYNTPWFHVAKPARVPDRLPVGRARVGHEPRLRLPVRQQVQRVALEVGELDPLAHGVLDAVRLQPRRRVCQGHPAREAPAEQQVRDRRRLIRLERACGAPAESAISLSSFSPSRRGLALSCGPHRARTVRGGSPQGTGLRRLHRLLAHSVLPQIRPR